MKMNNIYSFINPRSNDQLSNFKHYDLNQLLYLLSKYYLDYRDKLNLDKKTTFGIEIEFENVNERFNEDFKLLKSKWNLEHDHSLYKGREIKSPILYDSKKTWNELKETCNIASKNGEICGNSGGHVHIGTQVLGDDCKAWNNFFKIWLAYENIFFRFAYGEYLNNRKNILKYAKPLNYTNLDTLSYNDFSELLIELSANVPDRYLAVNLSNVISPLFETCKNTIEFRCPNGSLEPVIWQNNVNAFAKLLESCRNKSIDLDIVLKRYQDNIDKYDMNNEFNFYLYKEIYLEQALELCDLIFDNNLDKLYFLKQYLKSFDTTKSINILKDSKRFVRKNKK